MANEANQNGEHVEQSGMPTRVLRIDGERTGRLFTNAIRVGRIDKRLRDLSLSTNADSRRQFRLGDEGFSKAIGDFENAIDQIEKDLAFTSRSNKKPQDGKGSQTSKRQPSNGKSAPQRVVAGVVQPEASTGTQTTAATPPKPQAGAKQQQPPAPVTAPELAQAPSGKKRKKRKKPSASPAQTQGPDSPAKNAEGVQQPSQKADTKQPPDKAVSDGAKPAGRNAKPDDGQQKKPESEKPEAATPALS